MATTARKPILVDDFCLCQGSPGRQMSVACTQGRYRENGEPREFWHTRAPIRVVKSPMGMRDGSGTEPLRPVSRPTRETSGLPPWPTASKAAVLKRHDVWEGKWPNRTPGVLFDAPKGIAGPGHGRADCERRQCDHLGRSNIQPSN